MPAADTMTMQKWPDTLNLATKFYRRCVWHISAFDSRIIFEAKVVPRHINRRLIGKMSHSISAVVTFCVCHQIGKMSHSISGVVTFCVCQQIGKMSHSISAAVTFCVCHQTQGWICASETFWLFLQVCSTLCFSSWQLGLFTSILCRFQTNLQCKHSGKYKMRWIVALVRSRMVERRERVIKWAGVHFCEAKKQDIVEMRAALVLLMMIVRLGDAQRRVIGDNQEQRISQVRNHKRPCIYFQKWRPMREDTALIWKIVTTSKQTLTSEKRGFTDGHPPTLSLPARLLDLLQFIRWVHLLLIEKVTIMICS